MTPVEPRRDSADAESGSAWGVVFRFLLVVAVIALVLGVIYAIQLARFMGFLAEALDQAWADASERARVETQGESATTTWPVQDWAIWLLGPQLSPWLLWVWFLFRRL